MAGRTPRILLTFAAGGLTVVAALADSGPLHAAGPWSRANKAAKQAAVEKQQALAASATETPAEQTQPTAAEPVYRLNFIATPWQKVLEHVAKESGLTLVAKKSPPGKFSHNGIKKYTIDESIRVLNRDLAPLGYRLVRQQAFLVLLDLDDLRSEYQRPVVKPQSDLQPAQPLNADAQQIGVRHVSAAEEDLSPQVTAPAARAIVTPARIPAPEVASALPEPSIKQTVSIKRGSARNIGKRLFNAVKPRAELVDEGPGGFPGMRLAAFGGSPLGAAKSKPRLAIGIDVDGNRLVVEGSAKPVESMVRLLQSLDRPEQEADNSTLISAGEDTCRIAQNLGPQLHLIAQQSGAAPNAAAAQQPAAPGTPAGDNISDIMKGLKGDVGIESVPELGILIIRGGNADVEAVMKVIREIERLSTGAIPQIQLLPLQHVNSEAFSTLLNEVYKQLTTARTSGTAEVKPSITAYPVVKPNAVLVIAPPTEMEGVLKLAKQLDTPVDPQTEFQVYPLQNGVAAAIAKSVTDFFKEPAGLGTRVKAFADPRTNSVVVQARPRDLAEVGKLIQQLDGPTAATSRMKVFTLNNGDASSVVRLLETLFGNGTTTTGTGTGAGGANNADANAPGSVRFTADVRTNSIVVMGNAETLRSVEAVILRLDNSDVHQRQTIVIRLKNNSSDAVARAVDQFVQSQRELTQIDPELMSNVELLEREVIVVSEPSSNSLLLSATPRYFADLRQMVDRLDAAPAQVVIQALLVEVNLENVDEFGIEFGFQDSVLFDRSTISNLLTVTDTFSTPATGIATTTQRVISQEAVPGFRFGDPNTPLGSNPALNQERVGGQQLTNFGVGRINGDLGVSGLVLSASSESVSALLRALSHKRTVHVLSRPQIRTLDNKEATMQVGQLVPVIQTFTTNLSGSVSPVTRYDAAGIILTVLPRIAPDGMISLGVQAERSAYQPGGVPLVTDPVTGRTIESPIKDITRAEAWVSVASGNTIVMGGMITSRDDTINRKVPWLGDLPLLGRAFRFDSTTTRRTELLIFLTPRVIRDEADDEQLKQIEAERIHFLAEEAEAVHGPIFANTPEFEGDRFRVQPIKGNQGAAAPATSVPPADTPAPPVPAETHLPGPSIPGAPPAETPAPPTPGQTSKIPAGAGEATQFQGP